MILVGFTFGGFYADFVRKSRGYCTVLFCLWLVLVTPLVVATFICYLFPFTVYCMATNVIGVKLSQGEITIEYGMDGIGTEHRVEVTASKGHKSDEAIPAEVEEIVIAPATCDKTPKIVNNSTTAIDSEKVHKSWNTITNDDEKINDVACSAEAVQPAPNQCNPTLNDDRSTAAAKKDHKEHNIEAVSSKGNEMVTAPADVDVNGIAAVENSLDPCIPASKAHGSIATTTFEKGLRTSDTPDAPYFDEFGGTTILFTEEDLIRVFREVLPYDHNKVLAGNSERNIREFVKKEIAERMETAETNLREFVRTEMNEVNMKLARILDHLQQQQQA